MTIKGRDLLILWSWIKGQGHKRPSTHSVYMYVFIVTKKVEHRTFILYVIDVWRKTVMIYFVVVRSWSKHTCTFNPSLIHFHCDTISWKVFNTQLLHCMESQLFIKGGHLDRLWVSASLFVILLWWLIVLNRFQQQAFIFYSSWSCFLQSSWPLKEDTYRFWGD